jgi:hypothetical protein
VQDQDPGTLSDTIRRVAVERNSALIRLHAEFFGRPA